MLLTAPAQNKFAAGPVTFKSVNPLHGFIGARLDASGKTTNYQPFNYTSFLILLPDLTAAFIKCLTISLVCCLGKLVERRIEPGRLGFVEMVLVALCK
jgi:hypothetical protein